MVSCDGGSAVVELDQRPDRVEALTPDRGGEEGGVDWARWFLIIGGVIGLLAALGIPKLRPNDEGTHIARVETIRRGILLPPSDGSTTVGYEVDGCLSAFLDTWPFVKDITVGSMFHGQWTNPPCGPAKTLFGGGDISNTEVNSPLPYLPAVIGSTIGERIGGSSGSLLGARLFQLAAYLALCWLALRLLPWGRPFVFCLALLPTTLQGAAGVSADAVTLGCALVAVALVLHLADRSRVSGGPASVRSLIGLGAVAVAVSLGKPAMAPMVLVAAALPRVVFGSRRRHVVALTAIFAAVLVTGGLWDVVVASHVHVRTFPGGDSVTVGAWARHHPGDLIAAMAHTWVDGRSNRYTFSGIVFPLGLFTNRVSLFVVTAVLAVLAAVRLADPKPQRLGRRTSARSRDGGDPGAVRARLIAVVIGVTGYLLVVYGAFTASDLPGGRLVDGVQGRYLVPYLPLLLLGARPLQRTRVTLQGALVLSSALVGLNLWWVWDVWRGWHAV